MTSRADGSPPRADPNLASSRQPLTVMLPADKAGGQKRHWAQAFEGVPIDQDSPGDFLRAEDRNGTAGPADVVAVQRGAEVELVQHDDLRGLPSATSLATLRIPPSTPQTESPEYIRAKLAMLNRSQLIEVCLFAALQYAGVHQLVDDLYVDSLCASPTRSADRIGDSSRGVTPVVDKGAVDMLRSPPLDDSGIIHVPDGIPTVTTDSIIRREEEM